VASQFVSKQEFEKAIRKLKGDILTLKQTGGGSGSTAPATGVPVTRIINTTTPLAGGGDLSADLTLSLAGLAAFGTGDFLVGVNAAGDAWEYKQLLGTANRVTVGHAAGSVTLSGPQDIHEEAVPTFQGLILGPEGSEADTWLLGYSYFDFGTTDAYENLAGAISFSGEGQEASGSTDVPGTRGTEWNLDTAEFVSAAAFAGEATRRNGCLSAGLLILHNETTGKFDGYSTTTGLLVRSTAAHNFSSVEGLCADGTYFYATGTKVAPGNERVVYKYLISDFSFIDSWEPAWPTYQAPSGIKYNGGYLFVYDAGTEKIFKIDVSDMTLNATLSVPFYDGSHVYSIYDFDLDAAGAYIYAIAEAGSGDIKCRKFSAADCSHVADGTDTFGSASQRIYHYAEGAEERFYVVYNDGSKTATKINPTTLNKYYTGVTTLGHTPLGIAADENYLYVFYETQGIDRHLKNDIGGTASTEAGRIRFWINALGSLVQAGLIDSGLNLSMFGYVEGTQLKSTVATGTPPLVVASETMVANLNADLLDGYEAAAFALAGHSHYLGDLEDVAIASGGPDDGDVLVWRDALPGWTNEAMSSSGYLANLLDVSLPSGGPSDGNVLAWDDLLNAWTAAPAGGSLYLYEIEDVLISSGEPADGDVLTWNEIAGKWIPEPPPSGVTPAMSDLTDVLISSGEPVDGDVLVWDAGAGKWVPAAPDSGSDQLFYDEFGDSSVGWWWLQDANSGTIAESGSVLTLTAPAGANCDWWSTAARAPVVYLPFFGGPFEVVTKINSYAEGVNTSSGLGVCLGAAGATTSVWVIQHVKGSEAASINCQQWGSAAAATAAVTTLPIWFRVRLRPGVGSGAGSWTAIFGYSTDGSSYTDLYTFTNVTVDRICLFSKNWVSGASYYISAAPFEFIEVTKPTGS